VENAGYVSHGELGLGVCFFRQRDRGYRQLDRHRDSPTLQLDPLQFGLVPLEPNPPQEQQAEDRDGVYLKTSNR
jgi:hypothetical protein